MQSTALIIVAGSAPATVIAREICQAIKLNPHGRPDPTTCHAREDNDNACLKRHETAPNLAGWKADCGW